MFEQVFFTNRKRYDNIEQIIKNLPKKSAVIFREYDLSLDKRAKLGREIFALCQKYHHKFIVGKSLELAILLNTDGIHFSDKDSLPFAVLNKNYPKKFIFTFAAHSLQSALKANLLCCDLIFISPIFPTKSHIDIKTLGLQNLRKIVKLSKKPVFALGGVNKRNIKLLKKLGIKGFGAIEAFLM